MTKVAHFGEFNLINLIAGEINCGAEVIKGIGDDAAVLQLTPGAQLLVASDMLVEGSHFLRDKITPYQLGYKCLAVNISDLAAMGGKPKFALLSIGWPDQITVDYVRRFYDGVRSMAAKYQVNIVGGDTVKAPQLVVDVTILGEAVDGRPVLRSGAKPGDLLAVTGTLGDAAAGLAWLLQKPGSERRPESIDYVVNRHLLPEPRVEAGQVLQTLGATAMMDISDGLASEVNHICQQSQVGAEIYLDRIPLSAEIKEAGRLLAQEPLQWALTGGEDYELLVTFPKEKREAMQKAVAATGTNLTIIGHISKEAGQVTAMDSQGQIVPLTAGGYNHFAGHERRS